MPNPVNTSGAEDLWGDDPLEENEVEEKVKPMKKLDKYHLNDFITERAGVKTIQQAIRKISLININGNTYDYLVGIKYFEESELIPKIKKRPVFNKLNRSFWSVYRGKITRSIYEGFEGTVIRMEMPGGKIDNQQLLFIMNLIFDGRLVWDDKIIYWFFE